MKLELIKNHDNKISGYKIIRETSDELDTIEIIRDMYFWGHLGKIKYGGRCSEPGTDNTMELKFYTEEYAQQEREGLQAYLEARRTELQDK